MLTDFIQSFIKLFGLAWIICDYPALYRRQKYIDVDLVMPMGAYDTQLCRHVIPN